MSFVKPCESMSRGLSCSQGQDHVHPHISIVPTLGMRTNMPFYQQKCFTPTLGEDTKKLGRNNYSKFFKKSFSIFPGHGREVCGYAK